MIERIRNITDQDFFEVSKLFDYKKSIDELKWLFKDPYNASAYKAIVAVDKNDNLIGVIGYIISIYRDGKKEIRGLIPMSWKINPKYRGFAGILLMKNALQKGEFSFAIGGTNAALKLYPMFKLQYLFKGYKYYKIFNPWQFLISLEDNLIKKVAKLTLLLPSFISNINRKSIHDDIKLIEYNGGNLVENKYNIDAFHKVLSKEYINWLLQCPVLKTYAFYVLWRNENLGLCVFYIQETKKTRRGRIVHLPYLGTDLKLWRSVFFESFKFFKSEGCCSITGFATNEIVKSGFKTAMYKFIKPQLIYYKGSKNIPKDINLSNWHIQFTEGDTSYLHV